MASEKGVVYNERRKFGIDQQVGSPGEEVPKKQDSQLELTAQEAKRRRRLERDPLHQGIIEERVALRNREYDLDLMEKVGKSQVITAVTPLNQQAGFYCSVCDCILRDSQSYLDHINGKWHNRALGMSMKVERVSVDKVKKRLEMHRRKKEQTGNEEYVPDGFETLAEEENSKLKGKRKRQRESEDNEPQKTASDNIDDIDTPQDDEMMAQMGFGGFGGSVKK